MATHRNRLTDRQERFAELYLDAPTATAAAISAGFSARSAWTQGCRLLKHPAVRARIAKLEQQRQEHRRQDHEAAASRLRAAADLAIRAGHLRLAQRAMHALLRLRALPEFRPK